MAEVGRTGRLICGVPVLVRRPCRTKPREFSPADLRRIALKVCARHGAAATKEAVDDALRLCGLRCVPVPVLERALEAVEAVTAAIRQNPNPVTDTVLVLMAWWQALRGLLEPAINQLPARAKFLLGVAEGSAEVLDSLATGELEEELRLALSAAKECALSRDGYVTGGGF